MINQKSLNVIYWRNRVKLQLIEYKGGACQRCGYRKPIPSAYDFHHRDPSRKDFGISGKTSSFELLKKEADKCDLLCKNCHAEVHHEITEQNRKERGLPHLEHILTCANPECGKKFTRTKYGQEYCTKHCYHSINKKRCKCCNKIIINPQDDQEYCSHNCMHVGRRKVEWPSKEELIALKSSHSFYAIGKMFHVSHGAVKKWCKKYEIPL